MLDIEPGNVKRLGRLQPGKLFLVDLEQGRIVEDDEVKRDVATQKPYARVVPAQRRPLQRPRARARAAHERAPAAPGASSPSATRRRTSRSCIAPMVRNAEEPIGSMGNDAALAVLSRPAPVAVQLLQAALRAGHQPADRPDPRGDRHVAGHRRRRRGQPARRERPSTRTSSSWTSRSCATSELETLRQVSTTSSAAHTIDITWPVADGPEGMQARLANVCDEAYDALEAGVNILILSDRAVGPERAPIPVAARGQRRPPPPRARGHAPARGPRARVRRAARGPPLRDADRLRRERGQPVPACSTRSTSWSPRGGSRASTDPDEAERRAVKALGKGLLKTISKMGISTIQSYCGAQIFEAVGLEKTLVDRHFTGTASRIGGVGLDVLAAGGARPPRARLARRARRPAAGRRRLRLAPRRRAPHVEPGDDRAAAARRARGNGDAQEKYDEYATPINEDAARRATLRGLMTFRTDRRARPARRGRAGQGDRQALRHRRDVARLDLDARRTRRSPMAMNRLGGRSNTGEGGEDPRRFPPERRRLAPLGDQAGRLRPLRRDDPLPRQRRPAADQDGPGRQARRGRPAARPQGRPLHRLGPPHDARASA